MKEPYIGILAGGRSTRMGQDKALVEIAGVPMLERLARTARPVGRGLLILGRDRPPATTPPTTPTTPATPATASITPTTPHPWPADLTAEWIPDPPSASAPAGPCLATAGPPDSAGPAGPMPALIAALVAFHAPILLLACDTPLLTTDTLRLLLAAHAVDPRPPATLAVSHDPAGAPLAQPTLAIYTPALLPVLRNLVRYSRGSFQPLLINPQVRRWPVPPERANELLNVNDPQTLHRAESLLGEARR